MDSKVMNELYVNLNNEIKVENDEQVVKISDSILTKDPNDNEVKACKIIALLKLSRFDQVTNLFKTQPDKNSHPILFYAYAYYLYKSSKYEDCLNYIKKQDLSNSQYKIGFLLLEAQIKYKQGNYSESGDLYIKILQGVPIEEDSVEIVVNLINSVVLDSNKNYEPVEKIADSYIAKFGGELMREFFFNLSLLHSNNLNLKSATNYLSKFKQIVEQEGDSDDAEIQNDLLMYDIQSDFISSYQFEYGQEEVAKKVQNYTKILEKKIDDYYKILIQNSIVCLRDKSKDVSDSIRKLDDIIAKSQNNPKFTKAQVLAFQINKLILYISKNKYSESLKLIEEIEKPPNDPFDYYSNQKYLSTKFYLLFRTKKYKEIDNLYNNVLEVIKKSSAKGNVKTMMQISTTLITSEIDRLLSNQKHLVQNFQSLYNLDSKLFENDVVNALVLTILTKNFNIFSEFKPLVESIMNSTKTPAILSLVAELHIKDKQYQQAIQIYERLLSMDSNSVKALERLCFLYSFSDWKKAKEYLSRIPQIDIILDPIELKRLENDYLPSKGAKIAEDKMELDAKTKKIKKRKRKPRYPKGFDPANPPGPYDKERWLPLMERAKYKKIAAKKGLLTRTQGAATGKETMGTFKSGPSTANQEVATSKTKSGKQKKR